MRTGVLSLIFAVFAVGCLATPADARPQRGQSLDQILPQIREKHPGTFYDAEGPFTGPDGQPHYRIKWMTPQGRVIWFNADARTGRVARPEEAARDRDFYDPPRNADDSNPAREHGRKRGNRFNGGDSYDNPSNDGETARRDRRDRPVDTFGREERRDRIRQQRSNRGDFGSFPKPRRGR